jgi:cell pole-organizing protein PopZ
MTDQTAQEPTMEEILASIRRIISEDDAPAEAAPAETGGAASAGSRTRRRLACHHPLAGGLYQGQFSRFAVDSSKVPSARL